MLKPQSIRGQAVSEARQKQAMEYNMQKSAYDNCRNSGGSDCHPPGDASAAIEILGLR
jgi:hypothetical protein